MNTLFDEPIYADSASDAILKDKFYTPPIALRPLLPYLRPEWRIWEPCCGGGAIVTELCSKGFDVFGTDIVEPHGRDFLTWKPEYFDAVVTNPPYSKGDDLLERCYSFAKPFAVILPVTFIGGKRRQNMFREHGIEVIMFGERLNFLTPTGKDHKNGSTANFETAWFTHGLKIGAGITFSTLKGLGAI